MTTCVGKSLLLGFLCASFVNIYEIACVLLSLVFWGRDTGFDCVSS